MSTAIHPDSILTGDRLIRADDYYQQIELWANSDNMEQVKAWAKAAASEIKSLEIDRA